MVDAAGKSFSPDMEQCIDDCTRTHQVLLTASGHALRHGGGENTAHMIRVMSDCVEMCQTASNFMLRGSPNHKRVCGVNARLCRDVAEEAGKFDDDVMKKVREVAAACAESCERMAA
ncbi:MAG: four-helix bundle copper-binding protein [Gemmatimonadota bacterium]